MKHSLEKIADTLTPIDSNEEYKMQNLCLCLDDKSYLGGESLTKKFSF